MIHTSRITTLVCISNRGREHDAFLGGTSAPLRIPRTAARCGADHLALAERHAEQDVPVAQEGRERARRPAQLHRRVRDRRRHVADVALRDAGRSRAGHRGSSAAQRPN